MLALMLLAIFQFKDGRLRLREELLDNFKNLYQQKVWLAVMIPFLLVIITAPYSNDDTHYLLERLRIKIPFLILPFAFVSIPSFSKKEYHNLLYIFFILITIASIAVFTNYIAHFEEINLNISKGQPIPTPTNHIRFSLMLAYAIIIGFYLYQKEHFIKYQWEKWLLGIGSVFLLFFIHLLSVRSGLLVFYLTCGIILVRYIILSKKYFLGAFMLLAMISLPLVSYYAIPSLKIKIAYMKYDYLQYKKGNGASYSDSERLQSLHMASKIIQENPIIGIGAGDLRYAMNKKYAEFYPSIKDHERKMPHNEYASILAGAGILGFILFMLYCFYPIFYNRNYQEPMFLAFCLIILFSFMVENTIENALGVALSLLFLLLGLNYLKGEASM